MNKLFVFLLVAAALSVSLSSNSTAIAGKNRSMFLKPTPTPRFSAVIREIEADKIEIVIPCPPSMHRSEIAESPCFEDEKTYGLVKIKTVVSNPKNSNLRYQYTVSGGRIDGEGAEIVWDLGRIRPGTYTISAQVGDGFEFSETVVTKTVTVRDCGCCLIPCTCPTFDVYDSNIKAGESVNFEVIVVGGNVAEITYNWTVSQGEIIEGQGTPKITVKSSPEMTGEIEAFVQLNSKEFCADCSKTGMGTATIRK
jgi:hypothetical protein